MVHKLMRLGLDGAKSRVPIKMACFHIDYNIFCFPNWLAWATNAQSVAKWTPTLRAATTAQLLGARAAGRAEIACTQHNIPCHIQISHHRSHLDNMQSLRGVVCSDKYVCGRYS
jgi:hypothetical protein